MDWQKLTKKTMPPENTRILLWLDYRRFGFPVIGRNKGGTISYDTGIGNNNLDHSEWRHTRWALIDPPEGERA